MTAPCGCESSSPLGSGNHAGSLQQVERARKLVHGDARRRDCLLLRNTGEQQVAEGDHGTGEQEKEQTYSRNGKKR
jgi:hypothetical protein